MHIIYAWPHSTAMPLVQQDEGHYYVLNAHYLWLATEYLDDLGDTRSRSFNIA